MNSTNINLTNKHKQNSVIHGDPNKKYSWIHIQDLAEAYLRVVGK